MLDNSTVLEYQWIDTASELGFVYSHEYAGLTQTSTLKFSKTDGVLNLLQVVDDPDIGFSTTIQVVRRGLGTGIELYLMIAGIATVVVTAGIAVVVMKKR